MHAIDRNWYEEMLHELEQLDNEQISVDGKTMKPSQCYHVETEPPHVLFNTNCPVELKEKVNHILAKYRFY